MTQASRFPAEVVVYRTRFCPYCVSAERLLKNKGVSFREVDVTGEVDCRRWLRQTTGWSTVPQIFVNGRSLGGFTELAALDRRGELEPLLREPPGAKRLTSPCELAVS